MKDVIKELPKAIVYNLNPSLPQAAIENEEESVDDLQGEEMNIINPCSLIDKGTRLKVLLGFKLSGNTNTLPETKFLLDRLYKKRWSAKRTTISKCS